MAIFVVFRVQNPSKIGAAMASAFPDDHLDLGNNEWLVSSPLTAQEVATKLGIPRGENGSAMVFAMGGYFGRAPTSVWDWIKVKAEKPSG